VILLIPYPQTLLNYLSTPLGESKYSIVMHVGVTAALPQNHIDETKKKSNLERRGLS
jgi:hypothetical protein